MSLLSRLVAVLGMSIVLLLSGVQAAPEIFPLSEIEPGMKGTVYTVMQGSEVVPIEAEILGVLDGGLGPGRDMIIGKLLDKKNSANWGRTRNEW